jgi:hypothetical protein
MVFYSGIFYANKVLENKVSCILRRTNRRKRESKIQEKKIGPLWKELAVANL